ncbi:hypothetical protein KFE25_003844 [Diacronema lutheri]|uniref:Amino acid transporter transmembrane domain-containing protein n=2 Tax=Diacronema lutheri TaxID=2081491 RepID=A0A8J5X8H2_DIALT|nr:hypothetical protein KFE25_003844 [Diacronema lutheri]
MARGPPANDTIGPGGRASATACAAGLANTILGAGILGLPYALMHCGFPLGLALLVACAAACGTSLHLLALSAQTSGTFPASFYTVASASIPEWAFAIDLAVAVKCFGVATSYLLIVGDEMSTAAAMLGLPAAWQARRLWVTVGTLVAGPLSCAARLEVLKFSSMLAIGCIAYIAVLSVLVVLEPSLACNQASQLTGSCRGPPTTRPDGSVLQVVPIFIFGFTCQQNIFSVVNELREPCVRRLNHVICAAVLAALASYATVASAGALVYGQKVQPDVLVNYPDDSAPFLAARVGISIVVLCAYPLQAHPSRKSALSLARAASAALGARRARAGTHVGDAPTAWREAARCDTGSRLARAFDGEAHDTAQLLSAGSSVSERDAPPPSDDYTARYWLYTALFVVCSWRIALAVTNLGKVMAVVGATGSTTVSYILPGACYWRLHPFPHAKRYVAGGMFLTGLALIPTALHAIFSPTHKISI